MLWWSNNEIQENCLEDEKWRRNKRSQIKLCFPWKEVQFPSDSYSFTSNTEGRLNKEKKEEITPNMVFDE